MLRVEKLLGCRVLDIASHPLLTGDDPISYEEIGGTTYVEAPNLGFSLVLSDEGTVEAVHLYSEGHQGNAAFRGQIPCGLSFDMSRVDVRNLLGQPDNFSEGGIESALGTYPPWDSYRRADFELHVEYIEGRHPCGIRLITLRHRA